MILRKAALLVGIDDYPSAPLNGCAADAVAMRDLLLKNEDGSANFHCTELLAPRRARSSETSFVTRSLLREKLEELLSKRVDMALFYFSGHGAITARGGILVTQDAAHSDEGVTMAEVVEAANRSEIDQIVILVDACYSGRLGNMPAVRKGHALLNEGVSIVAASSPDEYSFERGGRGVFSSLLCGALEGGCANVTGEVDVASVYSYVEQALGPLDQRPMFKSNVSRLRPLRTCKPAIGRDTLRNLKEYFTSANAEHLLDPAYEPDHSQHPPGTVPDPRKEQIFSELQRLRAARLLAPTGEDHLYYAAMRHKSCHLTPLGRFYWMRAQANLI